MLNVFDTLAMGNFPYASNYLVFQQEMPSLPPPDSIATLLLTIIVSSSRRGTRPSCCPPGRCALRAPTSPERSRATRPRCCGGWRRPRACPLPLHTGGRRRHAACPSCAEDVSAGVLYNASGKARCYALPRSALDGGDGIWDWQYCTQRLPQETYFNLTGGRDMFWRFNKSAATIATHCTRRFPGVVQRPGWIAATSAFSSAGSASHIIFSNGEYDPWRSGGVLRNLSSTLVAIEVPQGAHHLDLMFSNADDPEPVRAARRAELALVREWVAQPLPRSLFH